MHVLQQDLLASRSISRARLRQKSPVISMIMMTKQRKQKRLLLKKLQMLMQMILKQMMLKQKMQQKRFL